MSEVEELVPRMPYFVPPALYADLQKIAAGEKVDAALNRAGAQAWLKIVEPTPNIPALTQGASSRA